MEDEMGSGLELDTSEPDALESNGQAEKRAGKCGYKDRKLENRLRKYEAILKSSENINRVPIGNSSQVRLIE